MPSMTVRTGFSTAKMNGGEEKSVPGGVGNETVLVVSSDPSSQGDTPRLEVVRREEDGELLSPGNHGF